MPNHLTYICPAEGAGEHHDPTLDTGNPARALATAATLSATPAAATPYYVAVFENAGAYPLAVYRNGERLGDLAAMVARTGDTSLAERPAEPTMEAELTEVKVRGEQWLADRVGVIVRARALGWSYDAIGGLVGLSHTQVSNIAKREAQRRPAGQTAAA